MSEANADLVSEIAEYLNTFMVFPNSGTAEVLAVYAIHTWALDATHVTPYLYVHSPEPGSGKTTLLEVLNSLVRNGVTTNNVTAPTLTRIMNTAEPTLLFDEVDMVFASRNSNNVALQGVLNSGYKRGSKVHRVCSINEDSRGYKSFNVFGPKVLAGIHNGALPDTLVDRVIPIVLRRKSRHISTKPFYTDNTDNEPILDHIEEWLEENLESLKNFDRIDIESLSPRESEIVSPLAHIARLFNREDEIVSTIVELIHEYKTHLAAQDKGFELLRSIAELFAEANSHKLHTTDILDGLNLQGNKGAKELAGRLSAFNIEPANVRKGTLVAKGYTKSQFVNEFEAAGLLDENGNIKL